MRKLPVLFLALLVVIAVVLIVNVRRDMQQAALLQPLQVLQLPGDIAKEIRVVMGDNDATVITVRGGRGVYWYRDAIGMPDKVELLYENPELVAFEPNSYRIAAVVDHVIHLWDARSGVKLDSIVPKLDIQLLTWASPSPSLPYLAVWGATYPPQSNSKPSHRLKMWNIYRYTIDGSLMDWETGDFNVCAVAIYPKTRGVIVADDDNEKFTGGCPQSSTIKYNALAVNHQYDLFAMDGYTHAKILGFDGHERASIELPFDFSEMIGLWTEANHSGEFVDWLMGSAQVTNFLKFSSNGLLLLSDGQDGPGFQIWDVNSRQLLHTLSHSVSPPNGNLNEGIFIYSGWGRANLLATASADEVVKLWEPYSGELLLELPGHSGGVIDLAADWNAQRLVTLDETGKIFVWDLRRIIRERLSDRLKQLVSSNRTYPRTGN